MKTHRFEVAKYFQGESLNDDIHIDWPCVHRQAGLDHIQWLKKQDPSLCQLVLEHRENSSYTYLMAEIYSDNLATMYSLLWAK